MTRVQPLSEPRWRGRGLGTWVRVLSPELKLLIPWKAPHREVASCGGSEDIALGRSRVKGCSERGQDGQGSGVITAGWQDGRWGPGAGAFLTQRVMWCPPSFSGWSWATRTAVPLLQPSVSKGDACPELRSSGGSCLPPGGRHCGHPALPQAFWKEDLEPQRAG